MITIDDKEYDIEAMTDEQKLMVSQIQQCQIKSASLKSEFDIVQIALNAYVNALKEGLTEEDQDTTD